MELEKLIKEAEWKLESLPESYFINYFETEFFPHLKKIYHKLRDKCNEESDSLKEAELKNEFSKII